MTRATLVLAVAAVVTILAGAACSAAGGGASPAGRQFLSLGVTDGGVPRQLVAGTRIRLGFDATSMSASAGCNTIGGTYRIEGGRLVVDAAGMTEMGCDQARHDQDDWLSTFLSSKPAVSLVGSDLTLDGGRTVVRLLSREVAEPDANITGPTWTVVSIITGDAVSSVPQGVNATLAFGADGTVAVNTGCNQGNGTWKATGTGIDISNVILTKKACAGPEGALESAVMVVLHEGVAARIDADMLTLQSGAGGLQLQAR
jgi:heat shock protein HslJ